jgi:hypothetical protein
MGKLLMLLSSLQLCDDGSVLKYRHGLLVDSLAFPRRFLAIVCLCIFGECKLRTANDSESDCLVGSYFHFLQP